jgi:hypothetical protein
METVKDSSYAVEQQSMQYDRCLHETHIDVWFSDPTGNSKDEGGEVNQGGLAMASQAQAAKPFNVRLPIWASDFVDRRSTETGATKTQVVVDAISLLRAEHVQALMLEGYKEMRDISRRMAEEDMAAGNECLPEW